MRMVISLTPDWSEISLIFHISYALLIDYRLSCFRCQYGYEHDQDGDTSCKIGESSEFGGELPKLNHSSDADVSNVSNEESRDICGCKIRHRRGHAMDGYDAENESD